MSASKHRQTQEHVARELHPKDNVSSLSIQQRDDLPQTDSEDTSQLSPPQQNFKNMFRIHHLGKILRFLVIKECTSLQQMEVDTILSQT